MNEACMHPYLVVASDADIINGSDESEAILDGVVAFPTSLVIPLIVKDARACPATVKVTRQRIEAGKTHVWFKIVERAFDGDSDKMESYLHAWSHFARDNKLN